MPWEAGTEAANLLPELLGGLAARRGGRGSSDGDLLAAFERFRESWERRIKVFDADAVPPRSVGSALSHAVSAAPYLLSVFGDHRGPATEEVNEPDRPPEISSLLPSAEVLESAFGLPQWELDDLRDEVDRRASRTLKQARAVEVLWSRFRLPQAGPDLLFRALFPRWSPPGRIGFVRRGGQLYVLCDQSPPSAPSSLFLPWVSTPPLAFEARLVDAGTREEIGRGIGSTDEETCELLASMIVVVPRQGAIAHLAHDGWRSRGYAALSGLGNRYGGASWICRPLAPDEVDWTRWLLPHDGKLEVGDAEGYFNQSARQRTELATQAIYAELLARVTLEHPMEPSLPTHEDLELYDAGAWLRSALEPLPNWARSPAARSRVAASTGLPSAVVEAAMDEVARRWQTAIDAQWCTDDPASLAGKLVPRIALLHSSLRRLVRVPPDPRGHHRDTLLIFAAHDLAESRVDHVWPNTGSGPVRTTSAPIEELVGMSFWGAWLRLLNEANHDTSTLF